MDPHLIPLLENPPTLRPPTLPRCTGSSRFASRHCCEKLSLKILADQLRLSPKWTIQNADTNQGTQSEVSNPRAIFADHLLVMLLRARNIHAYENRNRDSAFCEVPHYLFNDHVVN